MSTHVKAQRIVIRDPVLELSIRMPLVRVKRQIGTFGCTRIFIRDPELFRSVRMSLIRVKRLIYAFICTRICIRDPDLIRRLRESRGWIPGPRSVVTRSASDSLDVLVANGEQMFNPSVVSLDDKVFRGFVPDIIAAPESFLRIELVQPGRVSVVRTRSE